MPNQKLVVIYLGIMSSIEYFRHFVSEQKEQQELADVHFKRVESLANLFSLLSDPWYNIDYVVIDIGLLSNVKETDSSDIIKSIRTMISYTTVIDIEGGMKKRDTKIIGMVSKDTYPLVIKKFMKNTDCIIPNIDGGWSIEDIRMESVKVYIQKDYTISDKIKPLLRKKLQSTVKKQDGIQLTAREQQIFSLLTERGITNKNISRSLGISESTVKLHLTHIFKKYGVRNRTQLAVFSKQQLSNV